MNEAGVTAYIAAFDYDFCTTSGLVSGTTGSGSAIGSTTGSSTGVSTGTGSSTVTLGSSSTTTGGGSPTSSAPSYLLSVSYGEPVAYRRQESSYSFYIGRNGTAAGTCQQAAAFTFTMNGELEDADGFIYAPPGSTETPFIGGENPPYGSITTTFIIQNDTLVWDSSSFQLGHALFCVIGQTVEAVFTAQYPDGCLPVTLGVSPTTDCIGYGSSSTMTFTPSGSGSVTGSTPTTSGSSTGSITGSPTTSQPSQTGSSTTPSASPSQSGSIHTGNIIANYLGCYQNLPAAPVLYGPNETVGTLEECAQDCSSYSLFSVSLGYLCTCADDYPTYPEPEISQDSCYLTCTADASEICGGDAAAQLYTIISGSGTTITTSGPTTSTTATSTSVSFSNNTISSTTSITTGSSTNTTSSSATESTTGSTTNTLFNSTSSGTITTTDTSVTPTDSTSTTGTSATDSTTTDTTTGTSTISTTDTSTDTASTTETDTTTTTGTSTDTDTTTTTGTSTDTDTTTTTGTSTDTDTTTATTDTSTTATTTSTSTSSAPTGARTVCQPSATPTQFSYDSPTYNGGQRITTNNNRYKIVCGDNNQRMGNVATVGSFNYEYYDTDFDGCINYCEMYNQANPASNTACDAVKWVDTQGNSNEASCFLFYGDIGTENQADSQNPNYDANYVSGYLIPDTETNDLYLSNPIPLVSNTWNDGYSHYWDTARLTLPFDVYIYGQTDNKIWVSANGFVGTFESSSSVSTIANSMSGDLRDGQTIPSGNGGSGDAFFPQGGIYGYWTYTQVLGPTGVSTSNSPYTDSGIYYEIDEDGETLSIEFYLADGNNPASIYHYIIYYDTNNPGEWRVYYFDVNPPSNSQVLSVGAVQKSSDGTLTYNVPVNGQNANNNPSEYPVDGEVWTFITSASDSGTAAGTFTKDDFDLNDYTVGSWTGP